jgi:hypothetical protein
VFAESRDGGCLVASQTGVQSFQICGDRGEIALCLGRSTTSGGRRKLSFHVGKDVYDVEAEREWYKEPFHGEYIHRFVIRPFTGAAADGLVPAWGRALATGVAMIGSVRVDASPPVRLCALSPANVMLAGVRYGDRTLVLNEVCGIPSSYRLEAGGKTYAGDIGAYGIVELPVEPGGTEA